MKKIWPFILALTILKIYFCSQLELGFDEAYYYTYAKKLEWSYFDHPLMVSLMQIISSFNLTFSTEFSLRFFPILFGFFNPFLFYKICRLISTEKASYISTILYISTIYGSFISGFFILPDAPLSFFALLCLYYSILYLKTQKALNIYLSSLFLALALSSKYQAVFIGLGLALTIIKFNKNWWKNPQIYFALVITFLGILPVLIWNFQNDWDSFRFHSNRIGNAFLMEYFPKEIFGAILYQNPIVFGILIYSLFGYKKVHNQLHSKFTFYLFAISIPLIFTTLILSILGETLPHWSGVAYIGLIILSGMILEKLKWNNKFIYWGYGFLIFGILISFTEIKNGLFFNLKSSQQNLAIKGQGDPTQDLFGWSQLQKEFSEFKKKSKYKTDLLISNRWFPAGNLDYYLARNLDMDVIVEGSKNKAHQYSFKNNKERWLANNNIGFCIAQSNMKFRPENDASDKFIITPLDTIFIRRRQDTIRAHFVYLMEFKK